MTFRPEGNNLDYITKLFMLNDFSEYKRYFICKHGNDIQMCVRGKE